MINGEYLRVGNRIASEILIYFLLVLILFYGISFYINFSKEIMIILFILIDIFILSFKSSRNKLSDCIIQYKQYINTYSLWLLILLFIVTFLNIINFGVDSYNHIMRIIRLETIKESYDGYPIAWHRIFKFESDLVTYLLFDKIVFWIGIFIITSILIGLSGRTRIHVLILILFPFSYILKWTFTAWPTQLWILFTYLFLVFGEIVTKNSIKLKEFCILTLINFALIISNPSLIVLLNSSLLLVTILNSCDKINIKIINIFKIVISITLPLSIFSLSILIITNFSLTKLDSLYSVPITGGISYGDGSSYTNGIFETLFNFFILKKSLSFFNYDAIFYLIFFILIFITILRLIKSKSFEKIILIFLLTSLSSVMSGIGEPAVIRGRFLFIVLILLWIFVLNLDLEIDKIVNRRFIFFVISLFISILFSIQNINYLNLVTIWNTRSLAFERIYTKFDVANVFDSYHKEANFFTRLEVFEDVCNENNLNAELCLSKNQLNENKQVWTTKLFSESL
jgi:hypothetical protein